VGWFEVQRSPQMQVEECQEATEWEAFKVREASNAQEAVEAAADGELGCYRARPEEETGAFAYYRVTGDGIARPARSAR
jgi:hypothetical protein